MYLDTVTPVRRETSEMTCEKIMTKSGVWCFRWFIAEADNLIAWMTAKSISRHGSTPWIWREAQINAQLAFQKQ